MNRKHRNNQHLTVVLNQKDNQLLLQKKQLEQQEKKKPILLKQLENQLKHLDQIDDADFLENNDPYINDTTLDRLQSIAKEANRLELREIEKLCKLAIGKRILNIELRKKKEEHQSKMQKKEKIQLFFRENRIKRFDYQTLKEQKLRENILLVRAYQNGKGFVQSDRQYSVNYQKQLQECNYLQVIKNVNKIFYKNYSSMSKKDLTISQFLFRFVWFPIILFILLSITLPFVSFKYQQIILIALLGLILLILCYISFMSFYQKPSNNNQMEQSIEDVKRYFEKINKENQKNKKNIQWSCSPDFMYLEVIFHDGFFL